MPFKNSDGLARIASGLEQAGICCADVRGWGRSSQPCGRQDTAVEVDFDSAK